MVHFVYGSFRTIATISTLCHSGLYDQKYIRFVNCENDTFLLEQLICFILYPHLIIMIAQLVWLFIVAPQLLVDF